MDPTKSGSRPKAASDAAKLKREAETANKAAKASHEAESPENQRIPNVAAVPQITLTPAALTQISNILQDFIEQQSQRIN